MTGKTTILRSKLDGYGFRAYHATPDGERKGGLVLIQEIFGVTDHIRELCDGYAADGYEVVAPSLYDRIERGFEASYSPEDVKRAMAIGDRHDMATSIGDVQTCIDWLRDRAGGPVYAVGYCYGGSVAYVAACRCRGLAAASGYYGRAAIEHVGEIPRCPTILHFGERDASIPLDWVARFETERPEALVFRYPAGHGFNSDRRADYDEASAKLARERTLDLFETNRLTPAWPKDEFGNPL